VGLLYSNCSFFKPIHINIITHRKPLARKITLVETKVTITLIIKDTTGMADDPMALKIEPTLAR
jgi:hypothetical protein